MSEITQLTVQAPAVPTLSKMFNARGALCTSKCKRALSPSLLPPPPTHTLEQLVTVFLLVSLYSFS